MNTGIPLRLAAKQLGLHRSSLSRWIKDGAPCLAEGRDGRGHSAMVDVEALLRWRAGQLAPGLAQRNDDDILHMMEIALMDVLKRDELAKRVRITDAQAALVVLLIYERAFRNVKEQPLTRQQVPESLKRLCTLYVDSVERGNFQRRQT